MNVLLLTPLLVAACQATPAEDTSGGTSVPVVPELSAPEDTVDPSALTAVDELVERAAADLSSQSGTSTEQVAPRSTTDADLEPLVAAGDPRMAWPLVDLLRFHPEASPDPELVDALAGLTGAPPPPGDVAWVFYADLLLAGDVPAPPGYVAHKRDLHLAVDPEWSPLFESENPIDWREVVWTGSPPGASSALHGPEMVSATTGRWLPDGDPVVGLVLEGEARAYPERVLEAHGVVTDRIGDRTVVVVHGALDGLVAAYELPSGDGGALRSAGLLIRSRELLFDPEGAVAYDPVAGETYGGGRGDALALEPVVALTTSWGEWREAFPETAVVSADAGIGRVYVSSPRAEPPEDLAYPVGALDPRLPPREPVITSIAPDGTPVAFPLGPVQEALHSGRPVALAGLALGEKAGGIVVRDLESGAVVPSQQASWFAWSGAHPRTAVWSG